MAKLTGDSRKAFEEAYAGALAQVPFFQALDPKGAGRMARACSEMAELVFRAGAAGAGPTAKTPKKVSKKDDNPPVLDVLEAFTRPELRELKALVEWELKNGEVTPGMKSIKGKLAKALRSRKGTR